ncbi:MAG: type II toxin-antitoxin system PemK/MazF family toxin [Acidimicrobiales bacterium]
MGRAMRRGELWLAEVGNKRHPVLLLTRSEVLDARSLVTVAEITTTVRGLTAEVDIDHVEVGLARPSVINCDGLHTIAQASLSGPIGRVGEGVMRKVCAAVSYALGC